MKELFYESFRHLQDQVEEVQHWQDNGLMGARVAEERGKDATLVFAWGEPAHMLLRAVRAPIRFGGPLRLGFQAMLISTWGISALLGAVIGWLLCLLSR